MTGLLTVRDAIRDFLRKYDEITTPLFRFVVALIMFCSINSMYGYASLFDKGIVIFLMSVICALVSDTVVVLLGGIVILVNVLGLSVELGVLFFILFLLMYCMYMRIFPECGWILAFVPIMLMLKLYYAVPLVVVIFAGAAGIVPTAFGIVLYYFSVYVREIQDGNMLGDEEFQAYTYIIDGIIKNKEVLAMIITAAVVILLAYIIYVLPFDYSWYVAIGVGGICNILFTFVVNAAVGVQTSAGSVLGGSLLGIVLALFIQVCKRVVDYSRKETVQFEDDDYYYYVKAVPKLNMGKSEKPKNPGKAVQETHKGAEEDIQSRSTQGRNAQNRDTQNRNTQNRNAQNRNTQNRNTQNRNTQSRSTQNRNAQMNENRDRVR